MSFDEKYQAGESYGDKPKTTPSNFLEDHVKVATVRAHDERTQVKDADPEGYPDDICRRAICGESAATYRSLEELKGSAPGGR